MSAKHNPRPKLAGLIVLLIVLSAWMGGSFAPVSQAQPLLAPDAQATTGESEAGARAAGLTFLADAYAGKYKGATVTMTGPFVDADAVKFNNSMKDFQTKTGITIQYSGSKTFEASITAQVQSGAPPDIVDFPQPGLMATLARQGKVVAADKLIPSTWLKQNYLQSWLDIPTVAGPDGKPMLGGIVQRFNGKDVVWYPKALFDKAGYKIPQTWDELMTLTDQIAKDGDTAWCIGIGSGAATGWPATDWMEALMLRTASLQAYDDWVAGKLKFDSPQVRNVITLMDKIWKNPKYVYGGTAAIVSTQFSDAPTPMFQNPPKCWLHKQGNFITSFFPQTAKAGVDYDFFYLPPIDSQFGKPFEVAGDIMTAFNDKPATAAVMQLFSTGAGVKGWLAAGGALGPQKDASLDWYGDPVERKVAQIAQGATSVRFDGSDAMPGAVGSGSFWKGMTDYYSGTANLDAVLKQIDASWPAAAVAAQPTAAPAAAAGTAGESEAGARAAGLTFLADAYAGKYKGATVTMTGPFVDADAVKFNNSMKDFQTKTGITIQYSGSKTFEASITAQVQSGAPPDIVDFPQPGLMATLARQGKVVAADKLIPSTWLKQNYLQSWLDIPTVAGPDGKPMLGGIVQRFNGKDVVWYPKALFDKAGYKIPQTWDELMTLTDQIAKDGDTAWCIGIGSGAATGWPATDWMEALMLRTASLQAYDDWVAGKLKFDSPQVRNVITLMDKIWKNPKYVYGGTAAIVSTQFSDAPTPMFQNPPKCWLHKQGNFITSFFPQTAKAGVDYDFFYLPPIDSQFGKPFEVAGDIMTAFNDKPATAAVMQLFSTGAGVKGWLAAGGALGPQKDASLDWYGDPVERKVAQIAQGATSVRFDGSDAMPGAVGSGSFWKGMTDYYSGTANLDAVLKQIDASWPK